MATAFKGV